jgi:quercetin dioxygenase-like cupin family protein
MSCMVPSSAAAAFDAFDRQGQPTRPVARPAAGSHGVALTFETFEPAASAGAPVRVRPAEDILLRVIDGLVRLTVAEDDRVLGIGDEVIIAAGTAHRLTAVAGRGRIVMGFRPAAPAR